VLQLQNNYSFLFITTVTELAAHHQQVSETSSLTQLHQRWFPSCELLHPHASPLASVPCQHNNTYTLHSISMQVLSANINMWR